MKAKIFLFALAAFCLASCNKENLEKPSPVEGDSEYLLEILALGENTKSTPSTVSLNLANLTSTSSKTVTAQLKKKSGSSWISINDGVTYSWSATSSDSQKFSGSGTVAKSCLISAKAKGDGTMKVSASYGGSVVATQDVPVSVADSRSLSWSNATTPINSGEVYSAVLNSNFSCTASISSNNSSFLVGQTSSSLSKSTSVTFESNQTKTIYYKYTGSNETTVSLSAKDASNKITASQSVSVKKSVTLSSISISFTKNEIYAGGSTTAKVTATYSDGSTKDVTSQSSLSGPSYITISGSSISSQKAIGCLGQKSITASYEGKTNSASLSVISDFKAISLECELYCYDNYRSASGNGNSIFLGVPMNNGGEVRTSISGTINTYNNDSYNIIGNSLIKVVFENDNISSTGVSTDWMMPGDNLTMRISYLGEEVKSFSVSFN